jgi:acetyl/propionyl-CoA carboxylase alpha subunit
VKYHVLLAGEHVEVDVSRTGRGFSVVADGETHHVDIGVLDDGHAYSLLIDDRSIDVGVEMEGDALGLLMSGLRYATEVLGEREYLARSIQGEDPEGDKTVRANMTGIVLDVLVAPGDTVEKGQKLFILEAMKMENEVKAEVDGTVARVAVQTGATVTIGDVVMEIE